MFPTTGIHCIWTLYVRCIRCQDRMTDQERPVDRSPLSRELVVNTAIVLADEGGLAQVSMRNVAAKLGVTAMSLYNYFAYKDEMVQAMLDRVISEIELPERPDWKEAVKASSISTREVLIRHSWAAGIWLTQQGGVGTERLRHSDWLLGTLRRAGLPEYAVFHAFHILESYILGSTLQQLGFPYEGEELTAMAEGFLADFPVGDYPNFFEHVKQHLAPPQGPTTGYEFALDLILDGLDRAGGVGGEAVSPD